MSDNYIGKHGELNFEDDVVAALVQSGWTDGTLQNLTVKQKGAFDANHITSLEGNLRNIIFCNNRGVMHNVPFSDSEFDQILRQIYHANTPVKANMLINGRHLSFVRDLDSPDTESAGKSIYVTIFEHAQIASGNTKYQIARQTRYQTGTYVNDRRGDITLLINGLPVIHLELKARNVPVLEACNQIVKYAREKVFTGLMGLVQVFFAMNPDDTVYFANFGEYGRYNESFVFHWADERNEVIKDWKTLILRSRYAMLSIPEAHQLIGYYTVADRNKDVLKVMRSYQYYAVRAIAARTQKQRWGELHPLGGINWCTTGGGKTMSSFKSGQMIRDLGLADKVVFVVDRTELNNQSLEDYNSFSREGEEVAETVNTFDLFCKLKSNDSKDAMIVTSIQKMCRIHEDADRYASDLSIIQKKRVVFIVDEAQRSQFGEMHERVKKTFPHALFFGFTGTPIMGETKNDTHDTRSVFGDYISVYTIANGIRDGNVLGFDPKAVKTYEDKDLRELVALRECNASSAEDAKKDKAAYAVYKKFMRDLKMTSEYKDKSGKLVKGIEGYLSNSCYDNPEHRTTVVNYILNNWDILAIGQKGTRFHALLCTSSIAEAIEYYKLFKSLHCGLHVTALFDAHIGNGSDTAVKEDAIVEILEDYNQTFDTKFNRKTDPDLKNFKKDIMNRLAHKKPYEHIGNDASKCIDILIVVNQLLTGYDSQYINTLYLDNVLDSSSLIQAISRTNRVYDKEEKPFGIFRFFRKVYTMQDNLEEALRLYCEGDDVGVVVANVDENIAEMNKLFGEIKRIFDNDGIKNYTRLPKDDADRQAFKVLFCNLKSRLNAVRLQGGLKVKKIGDMEVSWDKDSENGQKLDFDCDVYNNLQYRYGDVGNRDTKSATSGSKFGFHIQTTISEIEMDKIDNDYLEKHFRQIVPVLVDMDEDVTVKNEAIEDIHIDFGRLSERQQRYGDKVLTDIRDGILVPDGRKFVDYISEYIEQAENDAMEAVGAETGVDVDMLKALVKENPDERNLNEGMRFKRLLDSSTVQGKEKVNLSKRLKTFILNEVHTV